MPEVLLFGATGFTGRLTANALARRGADFVISGRNREKLERLATETGDPEIRVAAVGDVAALAGALGDVKVLITCVGPFIEMGQTAVEAALRAKVHYVDSTGEAPFISQLIETKTEQARAADIAMVSAMGFDEVPADSAATLASEGMTQADVTLTYSVPMNPTTGTLRSVAGVVAPGCPWIRDGERVWVRVGEHERWAPMPSPLGPKASMSFPFSESLLAPLHLDVNNFQTYATVKAAERLGVKAAGPFLKYLDTAVVKAGIEKILERLPEGPTDEQRTSGRWTVLAEARAGSSWRNVVLTGTDVYGLTAEFLSAGALKIAREGPSDTGVVAPVQAVGIETWQKEFAEHGVGVEIYEPR